MGSNTTSQGITISFKGDLAALKSAASQAKTVILGVGEAAKPAGSSISSSFKAAANSIQNFSSKALIAGENTSKLASLQAKAGEAAARLQLAQANAAKALKQATDMENSGKASAEQLAVAQGKAAVAAQQVQVKEAALGSAMQKVTNEEKSMASATQQDTRETASFAEGLNVVKGALGNIGSGLKNAVSGLGEFGSKAQGALGSIASGVKGAISGMMELGSKALTSGGEVVSGIEKAVTSITHFKSESSNMHVSFVSGVKNMISSLLDFTSKIGMAIYGIQNIISTSEGLAKALLSPAASAEQTQIAFSGLLGSAEKATSFLKDLRNFAATTPFEFPELAHDAQMMLSFGFQTRDVIPMMTRLGDAISAMGGSSAEIERATLAIGQMHAKTKVSAEEMNQLTELGIPAWDMLAKAMGKTTAQVMDLSSKGLIPADQGIDALLKGMERFKGGMDAQSKSFMGLLSNLKDGMNMALIAFGGPILDTAKKGLGDLVNLVSSPAFEKFAGDVGKRIATIIGDIGKAALKVKDSFDTFKASIDKVSATTFAKGISYLVSQFGNLFSVITGKIKSAFSELKDAFFSNTTLAGLASSALEKLGNFFHSAGDKVKEFAKGLKNFNFNSLFDPTELEYLISDIKILGQRLGTVFELIKITGIKIFDKIKDSMKGVTKEAQNIYDRFFNLGKIGEKIQKLGGVFGILNLAVLWASNQVYKMGTFLQSPAFQKFADEVGTKISNVFNVIGDIINNRVKPAFNDVKKVLESPTFETFKNTMGSLFDAAGGLAGAVFNLWSNLSPVGALFRGNTDVGQKFSDMLSNTSNIINQYVIPAINGLKDWINDMGPILQPIGKKLLDMFNDFWNWLKANGPTVMSIAGTIFTGIGDTIKAIAPIVEKDLLPAIDNLGKTLGPMISDFAKWEDKTGGVKQGMDLIRDITGIVILAVSGLIDIVNGIITIFKWYMDTCNEVGRALGYVAKSIMDAFGGIGQWIQDRFNEFINNIKNSYPGIYDNFIKPFSDAWNTVSGIFAKVQQGIRNLTGQGGQVKQAATGGSAIGGFAGGVENFKGGLAVVGEKGPELTRLPRGSDVYTASETRAMLRGMKNYSPASNNYTKLSTASGGGSTPVVVHNHITVTVPPLQIDGRDLTDRIGPHVGEYVAYAMTRKGRL